MEHAGLFGFFERRARFVELPLTRVDRVEQVDGSGQRRVGPSAPFAMKARPGLN